MHLVCQEASGRIAGITIHLLSRLAMRGVPLAVIAAQLGHADTRTVEKHYGHLAPSIAITVCAAFGTLGIVEPSNVEPMISFFGMQEMEK